MLSRTNAVSMTEPLAVFALLRNLLDPTSRTLPRDATGHPRGGIKTFYYD